MTEENQEYISFRIAVPPAFEEVFSHFYFARNNSVQTITKTLLPSYQTILIFSFGTKGSLHSRQDTQVVIDKCIVLGPIKQAFDYTLDVHSEILVASFKDDAFYRFFGNASSAENRPLNPDDLLDENCFTTLWHELSRINEIENRVKHILEFCKPYLRSRNAITERLTNLQEQRLNPIKVVANENNHTERSIQLKHKKHFGYSAKELNRYQRFLKAIGSIQSVAATSSKIDWFEVINECGYYDQSQLIHDFKHYINLSPTKYLKFQQDICGGKS